MIRKAQAEDLERVMEITARTIALMRAEGNPQWDEKYPAREDFASDIEAGTLYVCEDEGAVLGMACINCEEPAEYGTLPWARQGPCTVIHRLAVAPESRGHGVGRALIEYGDHVARENKTNYLKSDTYGQNEKMNALLQKCGYVFRGNMHFKGKEGLFNCYDKSLLNTAISL